MGTVTGKDGAVCRLKLRQGNGYVVERPLQLVCDLEIGGDRVRGDRSEAWDRETMFSQLAKRSSQNVDNGVRHNKYFRSTINLFEIVCKIYVFCPGKVSGERLISHGTVSFVQENIRWKRHR